MLVLHLAENNTNAFLQTQSTFGVRSLLFLAFFLFFGFFGHAEFLLRNGFEFIRVSD